MLKRRTVVLGASALAFAVCAAASVLVTHAVQRPGASTSGVSSSVAPVGPTTRPAADEEVDVTSLPLVTFDAVVPELLPAGQDQVLATARAGRDLVMTATPGGAPVGVLPGRDFLDDPTVVAVVEERGDVVKVLTPARRVLPSAVAPASPGSADAQTAAWTARAHLDGMTRVTTSVTVSVGEQRLTVSSPAGQTAFPVGVGAAETATPTGVTGYVQARYLDPAQGQTRFPITLTSLHSTAADEPYGGSDGGLIGIHFASTATGAVSHGCIRGDETVMRALAEVPLGTPIIVTD